MKMIARQPFKARTSEEVLGLLGAAATAILAVVIISMLYFGRDILVAVALAILLLVLAPRRSHLSAHSACRGLSCGERRYPFVRADFCDGQPALQPNFPNSRDLPNSQSTISQEDFNRSGTRSRIRRWSARPDMLKDLSKNWISRKTLSVPRLSSPTLSTNSPAPLTPVPVEVRQPIPGRWKACAR